LVDALAAELVAEAATDEGPGGGTDRIRADGGENPDSAGAHSERRLPHRKPGSERHNRSGIEV
jgi:hypothetical protein